MGKCQCREFFIFIRKFCKLIDHIDQLLLNKLQRLCHDNDIGIVTDIAGCCAKMDDTCCLRALLSVCVYMAHYIMSDLFFAFLCHIVIDVIQMLLQLIDLLLCDDRFAILGQSQLHLCLCKFNPESSPCSEFLIRRKNILHLLAGITL